jgi:hypothetical protein
VSRSVILQYSMAIRAMEKQLAIDPLRPENDNSGIEKALRVNVTGHFVCLYVCVFACVPATDEQFPL